MLHLRPHSLEVWQGAKHNQAPWFWPRPPAVQVLLPSRPPGIVQAWESPATSPRKREGFLHQLLTEAKVCNSLHSREHPHRTEVHLHVGSSQEPNSKYPATWAQVSKAKLSGIASSVHSEGKKEGKGMCPPAPRLSFVPQSWELCPLSPARTGRQTGLSSDCMP